MRRSLQYLGFTAFSLVLLMSLALHARSVRAHADAGLNRQSALVKSLQLTDLCLTTEARYTRHPSLADRHAAYQDHPLSLEHFPSGSLIMPPPHLREVQ
ncbi:MAG TPA: hypothetical protein HPP94_00505 [Desulfuromonadales bacterium]|nr:hypothetical protein [Desulfuromonadales bacterium]